MEKLRVHRGQSAFFLFDGVCSEHHKGQRLQVLEDRVSNRRLAGPCLVDFDWWKGLVIKSLRQSLGQSLGQSLVQSLVTLRGSWLRGTRGG